MQLSRRLITRSPRVLIIGGSFAGLFAAAAAARAGAEVIVLERDRLTDRAEPRPGVPQGVQPHILLHRGLLAAEALLPGLKNDVLRAGGLSLDTGRLPWLNQHGWMPTHLPSYDILSISRPILELLVRRRVLAIPGVRLRDGFRVSGLGRSGKGWQVRDPAGETVRGELVIDASGRGSRLPRWLAELGYPVPEPEGVEARLGYASRRYQGGEPPPLETGMVIVATPDSPVGTTILPIEDRQWLVLAAGYGERRPSRDTEAFADFLASVRDRAAIDLVSTLRPLGDVAVYRQTGNRRMPYGRATPWPPGLLAIGDALCAFNPIYGQGITVAAVQAELFGQAIAEVRALGGTRRLQRRLRAITDLPWSVATSEDVRHPTSDRRPTLAQRLLRHWTDRMTRLAVSGDPACATALTQIYHLVGAPGHLFSPRVVAAVLRSYLNGMPMPMPRPAVLDGLRPGPLADETRVPAQAVDPPP